MKTTLALLLCMTLPGMGATKYVDSAATGAGNGTSWTDAWTTLGAITGISAGDTVYISGGTAGSSKTYTVSQWAPTGGSSMAARVTYKIGQEAGHNGLAVFNCGADTFMVPNSYTVLSGDAGDGAMHFALTNQGASYEFYIGTSVGIRISYVNFGRVTGGNTGGLAPIKASNTRQLEVDNCFIYITGDYCDTVVNIDVLDGAGYDDTLLHNNEIWIPNYDTTAAGPDVFSISGNGASIYSNRVYSYVTQTYNSDGATAQHQDFYQGLWGSYWKIYANLIVDLGNSAMESGANFGSISHVRIWNNVCVWTYPGRRSSRGFEILGNNYSVSDVRIFNNTFVNLTNDVTSGGINFAPVAAVRLVGAGPFSECYVDNNLCVPYRWTDLGTAYSYVAGVTGSHNVIQNNNLAAYFVGYAGMSSNVVPNVRPTVAGLSTLAVGADLSAYATTDADGVTRGPAPWVVGAYTSSGGSNGLVASSQVTATNVTYNLVKVGETSTNWFGITNNAATDTNLIGTASIASPFSVPIGASYNLATNTGQAIAVKYAPSVQGLNAGTLSFTDNGSTPPIYVSASAWTNQTWWTVTNGEYWYMDGALVVPPFTQTGVGANAEVSQTIETGIADGGRAYFYFETTNAAPTNFFVTARVFGPGDGANSFFVNVDADPTSPTNIWDIPVTTDFATRTVTWRGSSADTSGNNPEFSPAVFTLSAGQHYIVFVGREANARLAAVMFSMYITNTTGPPPPAPNPPTLGVIANRTVNEFVGFALTNAATGTNPISYQLTTAPYGAHISTRGIINWIPLEWQGPSTNTFTTRVADGNIPQLYATNSFTVTVLEVNTPPGWSAGIPHGILTYSRQSISIDHSATDTDEPANPIGYRLLTYPNGMTISTTGVISWTPSVAQAGTTNNIVVAATDTNTAALSNQNISITNSFTIVITPDVVARQGPHFQIHLANSSLYTSNSLTGNFFGSCPDLPAPTLSYSVTGDGFSVVTNTGIVTFWPVNGSSNYTGTVTISDNGTPVMTDTATWHVTVILPPPTPESIRILSNPTSKAVFVGQNAAFTVVAVGPDDITYQWYHGLDPITGATTNSYTRYNAQLNDSGSRFWVRVSSASLATYEDSAQAMLTVNNFMPPFMVRGNVVLRHTFDLEAK